MTNTTGPIVVTFDGDDPGADIRPELAAPVADAAHTTALGQSFVALSRPRRRLWRWGLAAMAGLVTVGLSIQLWDFVQTLLGRFPVLGYLGIGLSAVLLMVLVIAALHEGLAILRLGRMAKLQARVAQAATDGSADGAKQAVGHMARLYRKRAATRWLADDAMAHMAQAVEADSILAIAEQKMIAPLDQAAIQKVESAALQVATVTAVIPLALADVGVALATNMRMIRDICEIYGGRAGTLGGWRLARMVMAHLVATGAVAIGDDLIGSVAGGTVVSKLSRKFGEGIVNGALTARVGIAAIEVCRPMPFATRPRPKVTGILSRALVGMFR